jgi:hypothetical protein
MVIGEAGKLPEPSLVAVPTGVESKLIVIDSLAPKPVPLTVTLKPGGPETCESVIAVPAARAPDLPGAIRAMHIAKMRSIESKIFPFKRSETCIKSLAFKDVFMVECTSCIQLEPLIDIVFIMNL